MLNQSRLDWFDDLKKKRFDMLEQDHGVLVELRMDQSSYNSIKSATIEYLTASIGIHGSETSEEDLISYIDNHIDELANRTPNGALVPKKELEEEFNQLQRSLSSYIRTLNMDDSVYSVSAPIIVRVVEGTDQTATSHRPYSTTKIHIDPWGGDPGDEVIVSIPVLGDILRTTIEYFEPANEFEIDYVRPMTNYEEGLRILGETRKLPIKQRIGYAYLSDAVIPHRTDSNNGNVRITVECRLRRQTSTEERLIVEEKCDPGRLSHYMEVSDWHKLGSTKRMQFFDTYSDAKKGIFTQRLHDEPTFTTVDIPPEMFD